MTKKEIKIIEILREPCDCGDRIRHNNGGNYHEVLKLLEYNKKLYMLSTDTRELFPNDDLIIIEDKNGELKLVNFVEVDDTDTEILEWRKQYDDLRKITKERWAKIKKEFLETFPDAEVIS